MKETELALKELLSLLKNNVITIRKSEWWLLKYLEIYKDTYKFIYSQHIFSLDDGSNVRLPAFVKDTVDEKFLRLYESLNVITIYHRNEEYFEKELTTYNKIKNSPTDLKFWLLKNEIFGAEKYVCFLIDYLDYSKSVRHLKIYEDSSKNIEIYVYREDFKNTIEFLEIFNQLYWT